MKVIVLTKEEWRKRGWFLLGDHPEMTLMTFIPKSAGNLSGETAQPPQQEAEKSQDPKEVPDGQAPAKSRR